MFKNFKWFIIIASVQFFMQPLQAEEYAYHGKIEGMVCAFCAYNVGDKIGQLPGVKPDSVQVTLKTGDVDFLSTAKVNQKQVAEIFTDSGFSLVSLNQQAIDQYEPINYSRVALVSLIFSYDKIETLESVLDAVGELAAKQTSLISITGSTRNKIDLLKPIIAGRQRTIKIDFVESNDSVIHLSLYQATKPVSSGLN